MAQPVQPNPLVVSQHMPPPSSLINAPDDVSAKRLAALALSKRRADKIHAILEKLHKAAPVFPAGETPQGDCFCELDEMPGRLFYSKRCLVFQHDEQAQVTIELKNVTKISGEVFRKEVLTLYTGKHKYSFDNFLDVKSATIKQVVQGLLDALHKPTETASDSSQRRLAMAEVPGLKDQIIQDIFNSQGLVPLGPEYFSEPKSDAVISVTYPLALKAMFALMFGDSSAVPKEVHDLDSDVDLEPTHWELDSTKQFYSRHFKFTKKSSMVTCKVHQTHRVRVKSSTELVMEMSSKMEGVPLADTFTVETKWRMNEESPGVTRVRGFAQVDFKKRVFGLSSRIETASIEGVVATLNHYVKILDSRFVGGAPAEQPSVAAPAAGVPAARATGLMDVVKSYLTQQNMVAIGLMLVFLCFVWLLLGSRGSSANNAALLKALPKKFESLSGLRDAIQANKWVEQAEVLERRMENLSLLLSSLQEQLAQSQAELGTVLSTARRISTPAAVSPPLDPIRADATRAAAAAAAASPARKRT